MPPPQAQPAPARIEALEARIASLTAALAAKAGLDQVPQPSMLTPAAETTGGNPGTMDMRYSMEGHQHPRLTSTTAHVTNAQGRVAVTFTRAFANKPGLAATTDGAGAIAIPDSSDWRTNAQGLFTGCTITLRRYKMSKVEARATVLGISVVTGLTLSLDEEVVPNTAFSLIAVARSDVPLT